jgi:hypothetical protein
MLSQILVAACVVACGSVAFAEQIDNPAYTAWAKFKPGTSVTTKTETVSKMGGTENKMEMTTTTKLVDLKPDEATIEMTTQMKMGGADMPASTTPPQKIPAKIDKPADAGGTAPKVDKKEGTDKVEVGGKTYNTKTVETTTDANGMKTTAKVWQSDEVPGGMVKMESTTTGAMESTSKMTLVDVKTP